MESALYDFYSLVVKYHKADVTLVDLQRRFFVIRCCAKNRSGVTCHLVRFFVIFAVAQHVASF